MQAVQEIPFKFRFVKGGNTIGLRSKQGYATAERLQLNGEIIDVGNIVDTATRDNRLVLMLSEAAELGGDALGALGEGNILVMDIYKCKASVLEKFIDRHASARAAAHNRERLAAAGLTTEFRVVICPQCTATIDLSGVTSTAHTYCRFCESVSCDGAVVAKGESYRTCDECYMFDRVRGYTEFYFYFLLIIYGFRYKRRYLCDACAIQLARRMLLINLVFVLGVFPSIWMWIRASTGRLPSLKRLAKANKLARSGEFEAADALYDQMLESAKYHPGIYYNQALGHLHGGDGTGAVASLGKALNACGNYLPALRLLQRLQQAVNGRSTHTPA